MEKKLSTYNWFHKSAIIGYGVCICIAKMSGSGEANVSFLIFTHEMNKLIWTFSVCVRRTVAHMCSILDMWPIL